MQGRTVDMKTLTLIEEPTEEVKEKQANQIIFVKNTANLSQFEKHLIPSEFIFFQVLAEAEDEFERLLNEAQ